jgi:hypothetical protein
MYLAYWAQYALIYGDPRFGIPVYPLLGVTPNVTSDSPPPMRIGGKRMKMAIPIGGYWNGEVLSW